MARVRWADHADSTCGSLFHYKGAGDPCARIAHGRILWLAVAIALALTLSAFAAVRRSAPFEHTA